MSAGASRARPRVLVACDAYRPGYKGGSLWSVAHMVARLGDEFAFSVLTGDRDYGDAQAHPGIQCDRWVAGPGSPVFYASARNRRLVALARRVREIAPRALYLNSVFSPLAVRLLALRRAGWLPSPLPVVLAPTGELHPAALALKRWKKTPYLALARALGLFTGLIWRATDEREAGDVGRVANGGVVRLAAELPPGDLLAREPGPAPPKQVGRARLVYFSRVTPKKNLLLLLEALRPVGAQVELAVWGPVDDHAYWDRCRACAGGLPANVRVEACGPLAHERVAETLARFDALVLPTGGENYGYVVLEALAAGCPVLVSDRTPWRDVEARGAGLVLPLEAAAWTSAVEQVAALDGAGQAARREAARRHAQLLVAGTQAEADLRALLRTAVGTAAAAPPGPP